MRVRLLDPAINLVRREGSDSVSQQSVLLKMVRGLDPVPLVEIDLPEPECIFTGSLENASVRWAALHYPREDFAAG